MVDLAQEISDAYRGAAVREARNISEGELALLRGLLTAALAARCKVWFTNSLLQGLQAEFVDYGDLEPLTNTRLSQGLSNISIVTQLRPRVETKNVRCTLSIGPSSPPSKGFWALAITGLTVKRERRWIDESFSNEEQRLDIAIRRPLADFKTVAPVLELDKTARGHKHFSTFLHAVTKEAIRWWAQNRTPILRILVSVIGTLVVGGGSLWALSPEFRETVKRLLRARIPGFARIISDPVSERISPTVLPPRVPGRTRVDPVGDIRMTVLPHGQFRLDYDTANRLKFFRRYPDTIVRYRWEILNGGTVVHSEETLAPSLTFTPPPGFHTSNLGARVSWNDSTMLAEIGPLRATTEGVQAIDGKSDLPRTPPADQIVDPTSGITVQNLGPGRDPETVRIEARADNATFGYAQTRVSPIVVFGDPPHARIALHPGPWTDMYNAVEVDLGDGTVLRTDRPADREKMQVGRDPNASDEWGSYLITIDHSFVVLPREIGFMVLDKSVVGTAGDTYIRAWRAVIESP